jgi:hypothetical protein
LNEHRSRATPRHGNPFPDAGFRLVAARHGETDLGSPKSVFFSLPFQSLDRRDAQQPLDAMLFSNQEAAPRKPGRIRVLILARMRCFTVVSNSRSH